jgi:hypothetical protein
MLLLSVFSLLISCDTQPNVEGTWVTSYTQYIDKDSIAHNSVYGAKSIWQIKANTIRFTELKYRNINRLDTVIKYTIENGKMTLGSDPQIQFDVSVTQDSLVLSSVINDQLSSIVYKRLPEDAKPIEWNPTGKIYKDTFKDEPRYIDFTSATELYSTDTYHEATKFSWKIEHLGAHTFLVLDAGSGIINVMFVEAHKGNKVTVKTYNENNLDFTFEEYEENNEKPSELFGNWKLVYKEDLKKESYEFFDATSKNNLQKITIQKDTITVYQVPHIKHATPWKYYESRNEILLLTEAKVAKIRNVSKDSLVLGMNLSGYDQYRKKFVFTREK